MVSLRADDRTRDFSRDVKREPALVAVATSTGVDGAEPSGEPAALDSMQKAQPRLALASAPAMPSDAPTVGRNDTGPHVWRAQEALNARGAALLVDGNFGPLTERAVVRFQLANELNGDGRVGALTRAALNKPADVGAPNVAGTTAPSAMVNGAAPTADKSPLAGALGKGFQYLIGASFDEGASKLKAAGVKGAAVLDPGGATGTSVQQLKAAGISPIAYNNAFQTQPGEALPPGVKATGNDGQWGEQIPDFTNPKWQKRRIDEAVAVAKQGFDGVMLDNVPRAGSTKSGAEYVKKMVETARAESGNPKFSAILQNGEELVKAHPWLVEQGYVGGLQKEDVSYHVKGAGTNTGVPTSDEDKKYNRETFKALRERFPNLPMIAVDYPSTPAQSDRAVALARELGFNVSHVAINDGGLSQISRRTRVLSALD